jgi:tRNA threonylcarbamoyladenosine dehydratase
MEKSRFDGINRLYQDAGAQRLARAHVLIVGLGGVGSWAAEAIARSGIGKITLVDMDDICYSNTNRQLHALDGQYGKLKVEVTKERIQKINPECEVNAIVDFFTIETKDTILAPHYDYVIDGIDSMRNKCLLALECKLRELPLITTGGAGGKINPGLIQIADLNKTFNDPLLAQMRNNLKRIHNFHREKKKPYGIACVFSPEHQILPTDSCEAQKLNCTTGFGAITHITAIFGMMAAGHVINAIAHQNHDQLS